LLTALWAGSSDNPQPSMMQRVTGLIGAIEFLDCDMMVLI